MRWFSSSSLILEPVNLSLEFWLEIKISYQSKLNIGMTSSSSGINMLNSGRKWKLSWRWNPTVGFWWNNFDFKPKLNVFMMLELDVTWVQCSDISVYVNYINTQQNHAFLMRTPVCWGCGSSVATGGSTLRLWPFAACLSPTLSPHFLSYLHLSKKHMLGFSALQFLVTYLWNIWH